jgi:hypothetical protein
LWCGGGFREEFNVIGAAKVRSTLQAERTKEEARGRRLVA